VGGLWKSSVDDRRRGASADRANEGIAFAIPEVVIPAADAEAAKEQPSELTKCA
jgi:hypothetical protein